MNKLLEKEFPAGIFEVYDDKPDFEVFNHVLQVHSADVVVPPFSNETQADGMIIALTKLKGVMAIKTADCLPVIFINDEYVALIHAGWRGVKDKILLHDKLKAHKWSEIYIGPCIHADSFEVQKDFFDQFPNSPNFQKKSGRTYFDLPNEAMSQLTQNYSDAKITSSDVCTFKNNAYNSYRRDKTEKRNWNIFRLRG